MTRAEAYFELATQVIKLAKNPSDLRSWWVAEKRHRIDYGLSHEQIDHLVKLCSEHVAFLEDGLIDQEQPKRRRESYRRRRPAI